LPKKEWIRNPDLPFWHHFSVVNIVVLSAESSSFPHPINSIEQRKKQTTRSSLEYGNAKGLQEGPTPLFESLGFDEFTKPSRGQKLGRDHSDVDEPWDSTIRTNRNTQKIAFIYTCIHHHSSCGRFLFSEC